MNYTPRQIATATIILLALGVVTWIFLGDLTSDTFLIMWFFTAMLVVAIASLVGPGFPRVAVSLLGGAVLLHLMVPGFWPEIKDLAKSRWFGTSTAPSAPRYAVAAEVRLPPNTTQSCPGTLENLSLGSTDVEFNRPGCFVYPKVDTGRVILSGPLGEDELGPEGKSSPDARPMVKVRAKSGSASMRYILCAGQKTNPNDGRWSCS